MSEFTGIIAAFGLIVGFILLISGFKTIDDKLKRIERHLGIAPNDKEEE